MDNLISSLATNLVPIKPDVALPAANSSGARTAVESGEPKDLAANESEDIGSEGTIVVETDKNNDNASGREVAEDKDEDFHKILEKRLSDESAEEKSSKEDHEDANETEGQSTTQTDETGNVELKQVIQANLTNGDVGEAVRVFVSGNAPGAVAQGPKQQENPAGQERGGKGLLQRIISIPRREGKKIGQAVAAEPKAGTAPVDSEVLNEAVKGKGAEGQTAKTETTKGQPTKTDKDAAALAEGSKEISSNANQSAAKTEVPLSSVTTDPTIAKKVETQLQAGTDVEIKAASDVNAGSTVEKLGPLENNGSGKKQGSATEGTNQGLPDNNKSAEQKILENQELEVSYTKAQDDPATGNTSVNKSVPEIADSTPQNIQVNLNVGKSAPKSGHGVSNSIDTQDNTALKPGEQVIKSIRGNLRGGDQEIRIVLNPPDLGSVRILFRQSGGEITGVLEVEKAETRHDIERSLPDIIATLQESGVQVKRIEVVLNEHSQEGKEKNTTAEEFFEGAKKEEFFSEGKGQSDSGSNSTADGSPGSDGNGDYDPTKESGYKISDDAINVLV